MGACQPWWVQHGSERTDPDLIPIGRFARLAGPSIGALRHDDELDLLRPADVDRFTATGATAPSRSRSR